MPLSPRVARFNRSVTNRLGRRIAGQRFSPLVLLHHRGRTSGRAYSTPLMAFASPSELIVVLTYGPEVDWLKNLTAVGGGTMRRQGQEFTFGPPIVTSDLSRERAIPLPIRLLLAIVGVTQIARLPRQPCSPPSAAPPLQSQL